MSKLDYRHIDLDGATLVQRSHKRQVTPPGMWSVDNMYLSRSDNNPTLRPDLVMWPEDIYAISDDLTLPVSNTVPDIVNSVSGIYGSDNLVYLTSYIPWGEIAGDMAIACQTYSTGTVTGSEGSFTVNFAGLGDDGGGTPIEDDLHWKAWRGSILKSGTDYYVIDQVIASNPAADTGSVILTTPLTSALSGDAYTLYFNHNASRAAFNKIQIQQNGGYMIYATPDIATGISAEDISGPFASATSEANWEYGMLMNSQLDDAPTAELPSISPDNQHYLLATDGSKWIKASGPSGAYIITSDITDPDGWAVVDEGTPETNHTWHFHSIRRNSDLGFLASIARDYTGSSGENGVAWSSDSGDTWTHKIIPGYDYAWQVASVEYDGTIMTAVLWNGTTDTLNFQYSADLGDTWANTTGVTSVAGSMGIYSKIKIVNDIFVITGGGNIYYSADGIAFTAKDITADFPAFNSTYDIAYNNGDGGSDYYVLTAVNLASGALIGRATTVGGTYAVVTPSWLSKYNSLRPFIFYDIPAARFLISNDEVLISSADYGANWRSSALPPVDGTNFLPTQEATNMDWSGDIIGMYWQSSANTSSGGRGSRTYPRHWVIFDRSYITSWTLEGNGFAPISETIRANSVSVLDGYTVLVGTREYDGTVWDFFPRRVRWSVAGSPTDFDGTGSGTGDVRGFGTLLTSVVVNGRIVIFETVAVSAMVPRGDSTDPWDYDVIDEHFRFLSNPLVVGDVCYIVSTDGLLYMTDGISELEELGASFDLHEFDDFDESSPVWLVFSEEFNSIVCYYRDTTGTDHPSYMISIANGGVSEVPLPHMDDADDDLIETPGSVVAIENSSAQALYMSSGPDSADNDRVILSNLSAGTRITGMDVPILSGSAYQFDYWNGMLETGELYITEEGSKCSLKHLLVETYTKSSFSGSGDQPWLTAEVKSIEDSDFVTPGDVVGTATMTTSALTGVGTAWSNKIADGDTVEVTFTLPCQAKLARVYILNGGTYTLQVLDTDYTVSGNDITFLAAPGAADDVYAFWDAYPEVTAKVGDVFRSSEGWHQLTAIADATNASCDHYLSTGSETVTHYPAWQLDDGHGRVEIGINRLVEGVQIRLYIIPQYLSSEQPEIVKITGLSIGYVPQGRKILKATGS